MPIRRAVRLETRPLLYARLLPGLIAVFGAAFAARASLGQQCPGQWNPIPQPQTCITREITALANWDPDGPGSEPSVVAVAGIFTSNCGLSDFYGVALWHPTTGDLTNLGSPMNALVGALAVLPNGQLVAAGMFTSIDGIPHSRIAEWDGANWIPLGAGLNGRVYSLAVLQSGELVACGEFSASGPTTIRYLAKWNGASWGPIGSGISSAFLGAFALAVMPNGDLIVAGDFRNAGGVPTNRIARWNGAAWSALGAGVNDTVRSLAVLPNGNLVAGGVFTSAGGTAANRIAIWDGNAWSPLGAGMSSASSPVVYSLVATPLGEVIAAGSFSNAGGQSSRSLARWDGSLWTTLGHVGNSLGDYVLTACRLSNGDLVLGGHFYVAGGMPASGLTSYRFGSSCRPDFNCSSVLEIQDVLDFLTGWFSPDPRADFNGVGGITVQDIFDFLNAWFAGC